MLSKDGTEQQNRECGNKAKFEATQNKKNKRKLFVQKRMVEWYCDI